MQGGAIMQESQDWIPCSCSPSLLACGTHWRCQHKMRVVRHRWCAHAVLGEGAACASSVCC